MYILVIARGYPTKRYGLNGIFEFEQAKALACAGNKVVLAAVDMRSIRRIRHWGFESSRVDSVQIESINVPCGRIPRRLRDLVSEFSLKLLYKKIEKKYGKPDIIHAHFIFNGYYAVRALQKTNIPIVLTEHYSGIYDVANDSYLCRLGQYTYPRCAKVIAVSPALSEMIEKHFNIETAIIPNVADTDCFRFIQKQKTNATFLFVTVCNLTENKRVGLLVDAFCQAFSSTDDVRLSIIGEGPERKAIRDAISNNERKHQIILYGQQERMQVARYFDESDCFVLVSQKETFGLVCIEAMASGLPVIATKSGGPEYFVNSTNGILIPTDDQGALISALKYMYNNAPSYDHQLISQNANQGYSPTAIASRLANLYKEG